MLFLNIFKAIRHFGGLWYMAAHTGRIGDYILGEILNLTQPVRVLHLSVPVSTAEVQNLTENRLEHKRKDGVAVDSAKERGVRRIGLIVGTGPILYGNAFERRFFDGTEPYYTHLGGNRFGG